MAWETVPPLIVGVLGAGGLSGIIATVATRRKVASEAKLTDGQLSEKVNNMLVRELERRVGHYETLEARYELCVKTCREANEKADSIARKHHNCEWELEQLKQRIKTVEDR